ncbi:MAG: response regulator [Inquilinus sp.]|nr:response regulator [Inquilinus sp.]
MRVFVVDDDRDLADSLAEVLELSGHEVEIAYSGEEAVRIFREKDFDISFLDVVMPGMNGVDSFLEIRKIKPDAKVYMLTGYSMTQLLDKALENGALGVMEKPVGVEELLDKIEAVRPGGMVLVADGDPAFCRDVEAVLRQKGYDVCLASTGQEALERVLAGGIDVLALDLRLPLLGGLEVYLELKKRGKAVPTVIMSGQLSEAPQGISALNDVAVTGILTKPFDPGHLVSALERIVGSSVAGGDGAPTRSTSTPSSSAPSSSADSATAVPPASPAPGAPPHDTDPPLTYDS